MLSKRDLSTERVTKVELIPDIAVKNNVLFQLNCDLGIKEFAVQLGTSMGETVGYLIFRGDGKHFEATKLISQDEKVPHKLTVLRGTLWSYPEVISNQKLACLSETDPYFDSDLLPKGFQVSCFLFRLFPNSAQKHATRL